MAYCALEERKVPYEIQIYPGEGHNFSAKARIHAEALMQAFFKKYLGD